MKQLIIKAAFLTFVVSSGTQLYAMAEKKYPRKKKEDPIQKTENFPRLNEAFHKLIFNKKKVKDSINDSELENFKKILKEYDENQCDVLINKMIKNDNEEQISQSDTDYYFDKKDKIIKTYKEIFDKCFELKEKIPNVLQLIKQGMLPLAEQEIERAAKEVFSKQKASPVELTKEEKLFIAGKTTQINAKITEKDKASIESALLSDIDKKNIPFPKNKLPELKQGLYLLCEESFKKINVDAYHSLIVLIVKSRKDIQEIFSLIEKISDLYERNKKELIKQAYDELLTCNVLL